MSTIRVHRANHPFVQIDKRGLEDKRLSFKAKGILAYLLSRPDDWQVYVKQLESVGPDGRCAISSGLDELIEQGYIKREQSHAEDGKFAGWNYHVYEVPPEDPGARRRHSAPDDSEKEATVYGFSDYGLSDFGKPATTNKDGTNKDSTKKGSGPKQSFVPEPAVRSLAQAKKAAMARIETLSPEDRQPFIRGLIAALYATQVTYQEAGVYKKQCGSPGRAVELLYRYASDDVHSNPCRYIVAAEARRRQERKEGKPAPKKPSVKLEHARVYLDPEKDYLVESGQAQNEHFGGAGRAAHTGEVQWRWFDPEKQLERIGIRRDDCLTHPDDGAAYAVEDWTSEGIRLRREGDGQTIFVDENDLGPWRS